MDIENYDFESKLEQGFKTLFNTNGINLHIAEDVDGDLPDENVRLDLSVGGVNSNEHLKDSTIYDNYSGALEIEIQTPRVSDDQIPVAAGFSSRHAELVATARKAIEEIDAAVLLANWPGALSLTKIKPTGTERDNDAEHRVTKLSYDLQFRIT
jgi:hypothetical protein|tara:strand:+ start:1176 stop:1637 length:462 start_codon:yes stop_codon:yes gene_type:complete